jgi:hypothetical protein
MMADRGSPKRVVNVGVQIVASEPNEPAICLLDLETPDGTIQLPVDREGAHLIMSSMQRYLDVLGATTTPVSSTRLQPRPKSSLGDRNPDFGDFSQAYDEMLKAKKTLEIFGAARLANPPSNAVIAAQSAYNDAMKRYNVIVDALVKPRF